MTEYTITYTYDNFNRVIMELHSNGTTIEYEYDDLGRLAKKTERRIDATISPVINADDFVTYDSLTNIMYAVRDAVRKGVYLT